MRLFLLCICFLVGLNSISAQSVILEGVVRDAKGETLPYTSIGVFAEDLMVARTKADESGKFVLTPLDEGKYTIRMRFTFDEDWIEDLLLVAGKTYYLSVNMQTDIMRCYDPVRLNTTFMFYEKGPVSSGYTFKAFKINL